MPALTDQDFRSALAGDQNAPQTPAEEPINPAIADALKDVTGTTSVLSPWNNFWREANLVAPEFLTGLVSELGSGYDNMTGTGQRFSDRSPSQLLASIQEARYKLNDVDSQLASAPEGYARSGLNAQIATISADIEGMNHQYALKTGAAKPDFKDNVGNAIKALNDHMTDRIDEARGLKPPSPQTDPMALLTSKVPILGPVLGEAPPPSPAERNDPLSQLSGGLGQLVGSLPLYASGNVPLEFSAIAVQRSQAERDEARLSGVDLAGQDRAGTIGLLTGVAEAPLYRTVLGKFMGHERPLNVGELTQKVLKNFAAGAGLGAEQQAASNIIAVTTGIDPNRKLTDGMLDSIVSQSAMMGLAGGIVDVPSFLLNKFQRPLIDPYRKPGQERTLPPETPAVQAPAPVTPTTPTTPVTAEQLAEQLSKAATTEESVAARRIGEAEPTATPETPTPAPRPEVPGELAAAARAAQETAQRYAHVELSADELKNQLNDLRERLGPRVGFRVMTADQLPNTYKLALAQQGINPADYSAFYDRGFNEFFVNPQGFDSRAQLNDAIIRKFIVNGLADRASIHPVLSYQDVADSPGIANLLTQHPDSDRTTPGVYDKTSGNVYLNVPRLLASPDPVGDALQTAVHETGGHQGIRTWFKTDFPNYDRFLDRVYNGMTRSGAGDRIASRFGMNMAGLADHYDFDLGTDQGRRQLAEELLSRYAEQFSPAQLAQAPNVISKAVGLIRQGFFDKQGLTFSENDALNFLKGAWRHTDPELALKTQIRPGEAIRPAQKRIGEYGETTLADAASDALNRVETLDAARASSRGPVRNEQARGAPGQKQSILAAGEKLLRTSPEQGYWLDPESLEKLKWRRLGNPGVETAEHNSWLTDGGYVLKETRADGPGGPYGLFPALPGRAVKPGEAYYSQPSEYYGVTGASPAQYHSSYDLRNEIFPGFQTHFEGYTAHDGDPVARIVTSQPFLDERIFEPSNEAQRNAIMAAHGFMPIDDRVYYDRDRGILAHDIHDANLLVNKDDPNDYRVIDGTFAKLHGQLANHFDELLDNNTYEQFNRDRAEADLEARNRAMMLGAEPEEYEDELRAWQEEQAAQGSQAADRDSALAKEHDNPPAAPGPEEADLARLNELLARKTEEPIPQEVLDQLKSTLAQQKPTERVRMSAAKGVLIPDDPAVVRAARAAPDQLLTDRVSIPYFQQKVDEIYSRHLGNIDAVLDDFVSGRIAKDYGEDVAAQAYKNLSRDIRMERGATTDPVRRQQLDQVQTAINKIFDERGTDWGREGAARNDAWYGAEGILAKYRGQLAADQEKYLRRDANFASAVRRVRGLLGDVNQDVSNRLKDLFLKADQANVDNSWKPLPVQYADWVAKNIAEQARRAGLPAAQVPALEELFGRFRSTITQQAKENGIQMNRPARERMSMTDRIKEGLDNWDWMSRTLKATVDEAQKTFADAPDDSQDVLAYKQKMRDAFTNLGQQADVPFTETQLSRFLPERQVKIADLVKEHRSRIAATMDSLSDYLVRNSNLNPAQAELVQNAVASHVGAAIDVRRQAEFDRIIRDSAGKRYDPTKAGVSMQRFINLINMGAFDDSAVADALAPSMGYTSYDPKFADQLRQLGDKLEAYKQQGREGFQTEQVKLEMINALNDWRTANYGWWQKARDGAQNVFLGNILTGIPTHVIASMSDFFNGSNSVAGFLARLPTMEARAAAFPRVLKYMWEGFTGEGGGLDRFAHIMKTGIDPNREISIKDIMENAGEAGNVGGPQTNLTGWLAPYRYIFRSITALHALMRNGFEEPIEWLYGFDQLARQPGMTLEKALDQADEIYHGNAGKIQAAEQTARSEGLTGRDYRIRVQEQLDANRPEMMRQVGQIFGARTIYTQAPEGFLGVGARAVQAASRQMPALRYLVPFTNIVANVLDNSINFSPLGFIRFHPDIAEGYFRDVLNRSVPKDGEMIKAEELNLLRQDLLTKATLGTLGLAGMGAISTIPGPGGQPLISIHGSGPTDPKKRYQLMDEGWTPNSISFNLGGRPIYVPFEALPIAFGLQAMGNYMDAYRYEDKMNAMQKAAYVVSQTGAGIIDRSFLRGIKELFDTFAGQADPHGGAQAMMRLMQNTLASQIPYAGSALVRQLHNEFIDPKLYEGGTPGVADALRDVPFMNWIDGSKPRLNVLGEPIVSYPYKRLFQAGSSDEVWRFLGDHGIFLSDPRAPKILGQNMDEEQKYNFTKYHGQYLKEFLSNNMDTLASPDLDPEVRQKMIDRFGQESTKAAKADVIGGRTD